MYIPEHFEVTDRREIFSFIKANAFGQLISNVEGRLFSTHIPFLTSTNQQRLLGHVAKPNPQWESIEGQEVLVTFQGEHDYVSPSLYIDQGVPTWNYQAVHVYGKCGVISEPEKLSSLVNRLTRENESTLENPWEPEFNPSMLNAIVGLEIAITEIQCKYKLSQNRPESDRANVAEAFKKRGLNKLHEAMEKAQ